MKTVTLKALEIEEMIHQVKGEVAGLLGMVSGSLIRDTGQAHIAQMKLSKIVEILEPLEKYIKES